MDKKREKKVIQDIFAITSHCLLCGELPTDREKLLQLFQKVEATEEEIIQLAKDDKLRKRRRIQQGHESITSALLRKKIKQ